MRNVKATHTWQSWPVRVIDEYKDMRQVVILAGEFYGKRYFVHKDSLRPVNTDEHIREANS